MKQAAITIPEGINFSALKLERDTSTGWIKFDWAPIEAICEASGLDVRIFKEQHEDNVAGLIQAWYVHHLAHGGAPDSVQEQIIAEVMAETEHDIASIGRASGEKH